MNTGEEEEFDFQCCHIISLKCPVFKNNYRTCKVIRKYGLYTGRRKVPKEIALGKTQILDLLDKDTLSSLKSASLNIFKELYKRKISHQIENIHIEMGMMKKNKREIRSCKGQ